MFEGREEGFCSSVGVVGDPCVSEGNEQLLEQ